MSFATTQDEKEEALAEANLVKSLNHPNIVEIGSPFRTKQNSFGYALPVGWFGSLEDIIDNVVLFGLTLDQELIRFYLQESLKGLKYLHDQRICH